MRGSGTEGSGRRRSRGAVARRAAALLALGTLAACARPDEPPQELGGPAAASPTDSAAAARSAAQGVGASSAAPARPDAAMQAVLDAHARLAGTPGASTGSDGARRQPTLADAERRVLAEQGRDTTAAALVPGVTAAERTVRGAAGSLAATVYTPTGERPLPVLLYFPGGGSPSADRLAHDGSARGLAKAAGAVVVSVDVRRATDAPFPAQHDDALAAYRWALRSAAALGGDPARIALAGEGMGANLAVATAIAARDAALQRPRAVLAVHPLAQTDTTTASYAKYADAPPFGRAGSRSLLRRAAGTTTAREDARIRLVDANLRDLPPVTIVNAEIDALRDDGARLEQALRDAGSPVTRRLVPGVTHGFFGLAAVVPQARDAQRYAGERLKAAFAP